MDCNVWVDCFRNGEGNEDPFVFNDPWLYSYCHASQLRRYSQKQSYLQSESKIIFASGQHADNNMLTIDTVFLVGEIQEWRNNPLGLPEKYKIHELTNSDLWVRHLKFPFPVLKDNVWNKGNHHTISHSYEAALWQHNQIDYSFLPIDENNKRVSIPFSNFSNQLSNKIEGRVKGKYPVLLSESEINIVVEEIEKLTKIKVLGNITATNSIVNPSRKK